MAPSKHSEIGASGAHRWSICPGSRAAQRGIPDKPNDYALEGGAAHALAETCLREDCDADKYLDGYAVPNGRVSWMFGDLTPAEQKAAWPIDQEMVDAVQVYLDAIRTELGLSGTKELHIEREFNLDWLHPGMFGTADAVVLEPFGKLTVFDFKYGRGKAVSAYVNGKPNAQLMFYALGASYGEDCEDVEIVVVQPRAPHADGPVRRWETNQEALEKWAKTVLLPAARATEDPNAPRVPGDHCDFCRALATCPAVQARAKEVAKTDFEPVNGTLELPNPNTLDDQGVLKILESAPLLRSWLNAVEGWAKDRLVQDANAFGGAFKLVRGRKNRRWADETKVDQALGVVLEEDDIYVKKLVTPAQAEKALRAAGLKKPEIQSIMADLAETPEGDLTLAPASDKREAITLNPANDFAAIEGA